MKRPIAISLSPNAQRDDVLLALKSLFRPITWFDFTFTEELEEKFAARFGKSYKALAVNSGRSAEYLILKTLGVAAGDEVILQALTCVAVPNSIKWIGAKPVFSDVGNDFNLDPQRLSEKLRENTKAVIVQHSFGIPADVDKIKKILSRKKQKITLIEDCALALGASYKGKSVGSLGDVAFFSFGRDKVISSVFGGMILCKEGKFYKDLKKERDLLGYPSPVWLLQQLMHPVIFALALPLYNLGIKKFGIGKLVIFLSQKLGITSKAVYKEEERGKKPKYFPLKMPGILAKLALKQLSKLESYNKHRTKLAALYSKKLDKNIFKLPRNNKGSVWVRYPVMVKNKESLYNRMKSKGILLGDWYRQPVVPVKDMSEIGYTKGSCSAAEKITQNILNIPTYPTLSFNEAEKLVKLLNHE